MLISELITQELITLEAAAEAANTEVKFLISPVFNVTGYGAKGDGVTDDTVAIQNAINAANLMERGGVVCFPPGLYYVSSTLYLTKSRVRLKGERFSSVIVRNTDYGSTFLISNSLSTTMEDVQIEGLNFFHDTAISTLTKGAHLECVDITHLIIENVNMTNFYRGILLQGCVDVKICSLSTSGEYAKGALAAIHLVKVVDKNVSLPTQVWIDKCECLGPKITGPSYNLLIEAGEQVSVTSSYFGNAKYDNVAIIQGSNNALILEVSFDAGTYIDGAGDNSFYIYGANGDGSAYIGNITLNGTNIKGQGGDSNNGIFVDGTIRSGVYAQVCRNLKINGCRISGMKKNGIWIVGAVNSEISNNTICGNNYFDEDGRGVLIGGSVDRCSIVNNRIGGLSEGNGDSLQLSGIELVAGATNIQVVDNDLRFNVTPLVDGLVDAGVSGKRIINNIGFNENRAAASPDIPASTVDLFNPYGSPCWVSISGGTVSDIKLNGDTISSASDVKIPVGPGDRISITYSSAPTWSWWPM